MKTACSVAFLCCVLARPALPAGADPRPIDPARQIAGPPAAVAPPGRLALPGASAALPDELGDRMRRAMPDGPVALATRRAPLGIRRILVTLLEANAGVMVLVFMVLQRWRATLIPRLLARAERLTRRRRAAHRLGRLAEWPRASPGGMPVAASFAVRRAGGPGQAPWQRLYFIPLPQGHGSLRPTAGPDRAGSRG